MAKKDVDKAIEKMLEELRLEYSLAIISAGKREAVTDFLRKRIKKLINSIEKR